MNVSMGDAFNLGWKLAAVLLGRARPELLLTYSDERQAVAQDLIDFDRDWARIIGAPPEAAAQSETPLLQSYFVEHGRYTAGVAVRYAPSLATGRDDWQDLAPGFQIGTRFHSAPVIRQADARPMQLGHVAQADGRWRLYAFAPRGAPGCGRLAATCAALAPLLRRLAPYGADSDTVIDMRAVLQVPHQEAGAIDWRATGASGEPARPTPRPPPKPCPTTCSHPARCPSSCGRARGAMA